MYLLVDCNNFYVSCERVFRPDLQGNPVVVLSNNDGCVVSRSNEVKSLGIAMGVPMFKIKDLIHGHQIQCFSSNYPLYADFSNRVVSVLKQFTSDLEIYSIDECFLKVEDRDLDALGHRIRETVYQWTGIPVGVGFGQTKTQAKLANYMAKRAGSGVCDFQDLGPDVLATIPVSEIWGIGRRHAASLSKRFVTTVSQFMAKPESWVRRYYHLPGLRTYLELHGQVCYDLSLVPDPKKRIVSSRSFRAPIQKKEHLRGALAEYVSRAAEKCRAQGTSAHMVTVFIMTNRFKEGAYVGSWTGSLDVASQDTRVLLDVACQGLDQCYRPGLSYVKAGVMLSGFVEGDVVQTSFFGVGSDAVVAGHKMMGVLDAVNQKWGRDTVRIAASGYDQRPWSMKQDLVSPRYTTSWDELREVVA